MKKYVSCIAVVLFATTALFAGEGHGKSCDKDKHAKSKSHASCPMKSKDVEKVSDVEMTGKVVCLHCNLKQQDECKKVFQTAGDDAKTYDICPMTEMKNIEKLSNHGESTLKVKGSLMKAKDGSELLMIDEAVEVKPAA